MKPSFFKNELLATSDPLNAWVFQGLWCMADRDGRLEDRPRRIHLEINPGRAFEGTEAALAWLAEQGFILRYSHSGGQYIQIVNFTKHQNPHVREPASSIPPPGIRTEQAPDNGTHIYEPKPETGTSVAPGQHRAGPALSSFPLPDSPSLNPLPTVEGARKARSATRLPEDFSLTPQRRAVAEAETLPADRTFAKFCDYWRAASGAKARKHDWDATWRNWCRSEADRSRGNGTHVSKPTRYEQLRGGDDDVVIVDDEPRVVQ